MHGTELEKTGVVTCKRKGKGEEAILGGDPKNQGGPYSNFSHKPKIENLPKLSFSLIS